MYAIATIGVGNIGRRHLQSLMNLPADQYSIFAVEPFENTRLALTQEFSNISIFENISELPSNIDLAIIATSSNVRRDVFQSLINHAQVKNIIFEKVLFQKIDDYYYVKERLQSLNIKAWVNCARRETEAYKTLRKELFNSREFIFTTIGGQWGMGCNSVHMLDLIEFLSDSPVDQLNISALEDGIVPSKRGGFYEFFGTITGSAGKCKHFTITCMNNSNLPSLNVITTESARYLIDESKRKLFKYTNASWSESNFHLPYVSQSTAGIVRSIIETGNCNLPNYETSMKTHLKFIIPLFDFFSKQGYKEKSICPIT